MCEQREKKDEYVVEKKISPFFTTFFLLLFVQNSFEMYKEYDSEEEGGSCGICCKNSCRGVLESASGDLLEIARLQTATPNYKVHQKNVKKSCETKMQSATKYKANQSELNAVQCKINIQVNANHD